MVDLRKVKIRDERQRKALLGLDSSLFNHQLDVFSKVQSARGMKPEDSLSLADCCLSYLMEPFPLCLIQNNSN